jgi:hypothetical protein
MFKILKFEQEQIYQRKHQKCDIRVWQTSPYSQIEPAMAYQLGLRILVLKEKGVLAEGILEIGVTGLYLPELDCAELEMFETSEWKQTP